ncbi:MAG TPA: PEP/pyruvate-binding domain-containing protein [Actinoplanes sp.]|nr:PEP/pyruvate-binding domain-containing protein [Actinoplanes sp.]
MSFIHQLRATPELPGPELIGAKAHGLFTMMRLGLPVPPGFVISTEACRVFLRDGLLPDGLISELTAALSALERLYPAQPQLQPRPGRPAATGGPLSVSVRSGAAVSMPGMMDTLLNVGDRANRADNQIHSAVEDVFRSWNTPRAVTYRELQDIPHDLGTAVIVQTMVFGDRDSHSGSGVAFSRDPSTGEKGAYGDVLFGHQGDDVVSGQVPTRPLTDLAEWQPLVWAELLQTLDLLERHFRDVCHVEFTVESGQLWLLQVRAGGLSGRATVRATVDLADEGLIDRRTALTRVTPRHLRAARIPRLNLETGNEVVARGVGASPGVATGRIAVTSDQAARMAAAGPVILFRPYTSPLDMHGLAAAAGIVTTVGGPTSHAAVVARSLGKPSVVSATALSIDTVNGCVHAPGGVLLEGTVITIDGLGGEVVLGSPEATDDETDPHLARLLSWADQAITEGTT